MGCRELQLNDHFRFVGDDKHEPSFPRGNRDYKSIAEGFIFNAENRIISMETADTKLEFTYDYLGRRVRKKIYTGSAGNWTLQKHERFVYDGYKQVEKLDALNSNAIAQKFVWNGERILSVDNGTGTYYYTQDANKNVSELLASDGIIKAHYEYSPFGKVTVSNGIYADDNPYRFSSEVADQETGLVYYNYRYYSPELGRWLSRDPIGEKGGFNLYAMAGNGVVNAWDALGEAWWEYIPIVSTIGHLRQHPKGLEITDYPSDPPDKELCSDYFTKDEAIRICKAKIDVVRNNYISAYVGVPIASDTIKTIVAAATPAIAKILAKKFGARAVIGGYITGGVLAADAIADFIIMARKIFQMRTAADKAKAKYCVCCADKK